MKKKSINFNHLIFEFISVSFAVIFALFVNQWREDYNNQKLAEKSITNISEELKENKETLTQLIPKHKALIVSIDSLLAIAKTDSIDKNTLNAVEITLISSSAWEMAKITKAVYFIDFDEVNNLAKVYNLQAYYESIVKQYILKNSLSNSNVDLESLNKVKVFLEAIVPLEEDLVFYYNLILTEVLLSDD